MKLLLIQLFMELIIYSKMIKLKFDGKINENINILYNNRFDYYIIIKGNIKKVFLLEKLKRGFLCLLFFQLRKEYLKI